MKDKILENNKIIAVFMGAKIYPVDGFHDTIQFLSGAEFQWAKDYYRNLGGESKYYNCKYEQLRYHFSLDWLMPVVDKIESLDYNFRLNSYYATGEARCNFYKSMVDVLDNNKVYKTKHEAVYNSVVDFIKLHNKNKSHGSKMDY